MARQVEGPWYRASKNTWYATGEDGRSVSLGVRGKANRKEAFAVWARVIAGGDFRDAQDSVHGERNSADTPQPLPAPSTSTVTVSALIDQFLSDAATRLKASTLKRYREDLAVFARTHGTLTVGDVTHKRLTAWLASLTVSDTTRAIYLRSVSACLGFAVKHDHIDANPVSKVSRPKSRSRSGDAIFTDEDHAKLLGAATPEFRKVLIVLHGTGARPGEVCGITAENFDPSSGVVVLRVHKGDKSGKPRLVFTPPDVTTVLAAERERWGSGPLLRSRAGVAWNPRSIIHAVRRLRRKTGVKGTSYLYRHKFATDALAKGVPDATVASLLGHTSTAMIYRHYSHLGERADVLKAAADRVRG